MASLDMLDERTFIVGVVGRDPGEWPVVWSGDAVWLAAGEEFGPAVHERVGDPRLLSLFVQEYVDAVRYRRAAARRFCIRWSGGDDAVDQLIFPIRDKSSFEYVLVQGESVSGELLYEQGMSG